MAELLALYQPNACYAFCMNEAIRNMLEAGFYYHYKHDPSGPDGNYTYEVLGITKHTEDDSYGVIYRPLYKNEYLDADYFLRPLGMFLETVEKNGAETPRFAHITDPERIEELKARRDEMYPHEC
jgi:hypothetical protein